ncbi:MAG TPA: DUF4241 domain-containing protein [Burkholderiaceae bacterium]|nr:DUF4241 domain-containing protein [Burkholderiaceae bacterium]
MKRSTDPGRRALLMALGCGVAAPRWNGALAQGGAGVDAAVAHQVPLDTVADLDIDQPAEIDGEPVDLAALALGIIEVPSGRLAGVDALVLEGAPFVPNVPRGRYPLQIVLARLAEGEERVAFVHIRFADRPARTWTNAMIEGEDPAAVPEGELSVFEVESGVAGVFDAAALAAWRAEVDSQRLLRDLERVLRENRRPMWTWARVRAGGGSGFLVTSGLGAGEYAAYWGRDGDGAVVSFVLDFDLLDWAGLPSEPDVTI